MGQLLLLSAGYLAYTALEARGYRAVAVIVLIAGTSALGSWLAHYVLFTPMRRLLSLARAVRSGDLSARLGLERNDEIEGLASEIDAIRNQLEAARHGADAHIAALEQLRHADRVATLGRLASSVAHELGNPLNVIELRAQLISLGDAGTLHQAQQSAAVIIEQTRRMTRIIDQILSFARVQPTKVVRLDLQEVVRKAIELSAHTSKKHKTSVRLDTAKSAIEIDGDPDKLLQIIVNLVVNGMQAMPNGGTLRISTGEELRTPVDDPGGAQRRYACIDVADQGLGIPLDAMPRIFEPFFSTKGLDGGTGLGLSVAQGIAREHQGWISVDSELGLGSSFTVHLPTPTNGLKAHDDHAS